MPKYVLALSNFAVYLGKGRRLEKEMGKLIYFRK
jgi:hypothetical protein